MQEKVASASSRLILGRLDVPWCCVGGGTWVSCGDGSGGGQAAHAVSDELITAPPQGKPRVNRGAGVPTGMLEVTGKGAASYTPYCTSCTQ